MNGLLASACVLRLSSPSHELLHHRDRHGRRKNYVAALLTRALRRAGLDTVALKPICCGARDDVDALCDASDNELSPDATNPIWLASPLAPLVAARLENRVLDIQ